MPATTVPAEDAGAKRAALDVLGPVLRPELSELSAYVPHDPPGIEVKLDANEAPACGASAREAAVRAMSRVTLERYPDPRASRLKEAIAKRTGAAPADLLVGSGSDELIALVSTALGHPRERLPKTVILTPTPTFVMYRITARGHGVKPVEVPLDATWDLDAPMMTRAIAMMQPSIVFIASPNNPTGNRMSEDRLETVVAATGEAGALAIVDEAYVDYAGGTVRGWRERYPHLGILRTVSKIGLAALRVGWLEADAGLVGEIDKVRQPFNVSATSQAAAAAVLEEAWDDVRADVAKMVDARERLTRSIEALDGFVVTPSAANFLWVKCPVSAEQVFAHLVADKILVRSFHERGGRLATQLRITVGTESENDRLLASLERFRERGA